MRSPLLWHLILQRCPHPLPYLVYKDIQSLFKTLSFPNSVFVLEICSDTQRQSSWIHCGGVFSCLFPPSYFLHPDNLRFCLSWCYHLPLFVQFFNCLKNNYILPRTFSLFLCSMVNYFCICILCMMLFCLWDKYHDQGNLENSLFWLVASERVYNGKEAWRQKQAASWSLL